jgi:hypothetical protein
MPSAIHRLTIPQLVALLQSSARTLTRKIDAVHLHHTWRPTRAQFKGLATIEAMRDYHVNTKGWSDIAQHLTIDPHGGLWTGRNWNSPPASQVGRNGSKSSGPFMIEMVGDFDAGREVLDGEQRRAVIKTVAALMEVFELTTQALFFHRDLGSPKSCPGSGVDKDDLIKAIQDALDAAPTSKAAPGPRARRARAAPPPFEPRHYLGYELTQPVREPDPDYDRHEIPENQHLAAETIQDLARARALGAYGLRADDMTTTLARASQWEVLRPYVVNLTKGKLSKGGEFSMPDGAIEVIIQSIAQYTAMTDTPRVMLHAHGGLVGEKDALSYAKGAHQWWLDHGVYPIYLIWETSLFEILKQRLGLARGPLGDVRDRMFEETARAAGGKLIWGDMKESARLAASNDAGGGEAGGARIFIEALAQLIKSKPSGKDISVHAVGHSAGSIVHAHLLPELLSLGVPIQGLSFLAPAVRIDLFKERLLQPIAGKQIQSFAMFTMDEEAERDDDCVEPIGVTIYGKSLLYLVSRAFEPKRKTPILGLEEMLNDDPDVVDLFRTSRLELARARGKPQSDATRAKRHGCFDNEAATMASVLQTIVQAPPAHPFPLATEDCATGSRAFSAATAVAVSPEVSAARFPAAAAGRKIALCVGIDQYRESPLYGCVRDARTWSGALKDLQFEVTTLLDGDATRQSILDALRTMVQSARSGDSVVFQYSGHGSQVEDLSGDESDRYDETLVPIDYHSGALLIDDDLAEVYRLLPQGVVMTLLMDCCHSGTNSRFAPIDRRPARDTERRRFLELPAEVKEAHRNFRARFGSPNPTTPEESLPGVIHFAACLDNQYAYESQGQGHFTQIASQALKDAVARAATNEAFANDVAGKVIALGRPQTPMLMKLPAEFSERPILAGFADVTRPTTPSPETSLIWDEKCLHFFETGAAVYRQRLGR